MSVGGLLVGRWVVGDLAGIVLDAVVDVAVEYQAVGAVALALGVVVFGQRWLWRRITRDGWLTR